MNLLSTSHKDHFAHKVWTGLRLSEVVNSEASAETFAKKRAEIHREVVV